MKKCLLLLLAICTAGLLQAQITVLDFEEAGTTTNFQYFGGSLEGVLNNVIANPNPSGINTSATVAEFIQGGDAPEWGGAFSNPDPTVTIDLTNATEICIKVHRPAAGNLNLKLEQPGGGAPAWEQVQETTAINEWEEICFDVTQGSAVDPNIVAAGAVWGRLVLFFDFNTPGSGTDVLNYFDDVVINTGSTVVCTNVLDFEEAATTTNFQYFGGSLEGVLNNIIANPNPSGINTSAMVAEFIQGGDAPEWGGAFSNPDPTVPIDLTSATEICLKVHRPAAGNLNLKLEQPGGGAPAWEQVQETTAINEWEEICFDVTQGSAVDPNIVAAGAVWGRLVLFFDFNTPGSGTDVLNYFDDVVIKSEGGGPTAGTVTFQVDMNNYADPIDNVYVRGTWNNFDTSNEMLDGDGDGIYTAEVSIPFGAQEYKFNVNDSDWEEFSGLDECTVTTPDGAFTNRSLVVTGDATLDAVCWESCYTCGGAVNITFELGMGDTIPSMDGVWLAGGGNFDNPGGRFQ